MTRAEIIVSALKEARPAQDWPLRSVSRKTGKVVDERTFNAASAKAATKWIEKQHRTDLKIEFRVEVTQSEYLTGILASIQHQQPVGPWCLQAANSEGKVLAERMFDELDDAARRWMWSQADLGRMVGVFIPTEKATGEMVHLPDTFQAVEGVLPDVTVIERRTFGEGEEDAHRAWRDEHIAQGRSIISGEWVR